MAALRIVIRVPVDVATQGQRQATQAVIRTQVGGHAGLLVQTVVRARNIFDFGAEKADVAADVDGPSLGKGLVQAEFGFQLDALGDGVADVLRGRHPAWLVGPEHCLQAGLVTNQVLDVPMEQVGAEHTATFQVTLEPEVNARGQLGAQVGVAHTVGLGAEVATLPVRIIGLVITRIPQWCHQVVQRGRLVATRQAHANLVALGRIGLPQGVQQRCPHLAFVALEVLTHLALGQDAFIANARISRPVRVDLELVLRVDRPTRCAGLQVAAVVTGSWTGLFHAAHPLMLQTTDQLMPVVEDSGPFAIQAGAAVGKALFVHSTRQQPGATGDRLGDVLVIFGLPQTKTHFQSVIGRQALSPLAIQADGGITTAVVGQCGVGDGG